MTVSSTIVVTVFAIAVTVGAYALSLTARRRYPSPLTTPVLFSTDHRHRRSVDGGRLV